MRRFPHYTAIDLLFDDGMQQVARGVDRDRHRPVWLRFPAGDPPAAEARAQLRQEERLLVALGATGLEWVEDAASPAWAFDDGGGETLDAWIARGPLAPAAFYPLALDLVAAVGRLHALRRCHGALQPRVVLVRADGRVQLLGLGAAARELPEGGAPPPARLPAGDRALAYLAPEQTGRMNRRVDIRCDFYALGAIFHEMLAGTPPFRASDPLELVHAHLVRDPPPLAEVAPAAGPALAAVVARLLAKLPEERYRSTEGLAADLAACRDGHVDPRHFRPGADDGEAVFRLPARLYARDAELAALDAALDRVAAGAGAEAVVLAGPSGIGKSALVERWQPAVLRHRARLIAGRFEQFGVDLSCAPLALAARPLIEEVLAERTDGVERWRLRLADAVSPVEAAVIVQWLPLAEHILGPRRPPPELPTDGARRRLHRAIGRLLQAFAGSGRPLVLFLDDLHRADDATLDLLAHLCGPQGPRPLLFLAALRTGEEGGLAPEALAAALAACAIPVHAVAPQPLSMHDLAQLVGEALGCPPAEAEPLARIVHAKTLGNPFFAAQFLVRLHEDGLIAPDRAARRWRWDRAAVERRHDTDNVVELLLGALHRLPEASQRLLAVGGLLGARFPLALAAEIASLTEADAAAALARAEEAGLVHREGACCRFLHDRIEQAARALTPAGGAASAHARIGWRLLEAAAADERRLDEEVFAIAAHLDAAGAELGDAAARRRLAELHLRAGRLARRAFAHAVAARHGAAGLALLPDDAWQSDYPLAFALLCTAAYGEWAAGRLAQAERLAEELLRRARGGIDWSEAAQLQMELRIGSGREREAREIGLQSLANLGIDLPAQPTPQAVRAAYAQHLALPGGAQVERLADLPPMADPEREAQLALVSRIAMLPYFTDRDLWALVLVHAIMQCQRHGNPAFGAYLHVEFAFAVTAYFGDPRRGHAIAEGAQRLAARDGSGTFDAHVQFQTALSAAWVRPPDEVLAQLRRAVRALQDGGDRNYASVAGNRPVTDALLRGEPLERVLDEAERHLAYVRAAPHPHSIALMSLRVAQIRALTGCGTGPLAAAADATEDAVAQRGGPMFEAWRGIVATTMASFDGDAAAAHASALACEPLLPALAGLLGQHDLVLHDGLAVAALADDTADAARRGAWRARLQRHRDRLAEWATLNPHLFEPSQRLLDAECARLDGDAAAAMRGYEQAADAACARAMPHLEGLACSCAARFYAARGVASVAESQWRAARAAYARWGAAGLVARLEARVPALRGDAGAGEAVRPSGVDLDVLAVIKASQAISARRAPEEVCEELLRLALQQVGARYGLLLTIDGDRLQPMARAQAVDSGIEVERHPRLQAEEQARSERFVRYVWRSGEPMLVGDARAPDARGAAAAAAAEDAPRSVLAVPLRLRGELSGVLYLERRGVAHAFGAERALLAEQLAVQAAISLESARLYAELDAQRRLLEQHVEQRTAELHSSRELLASIFASSPALMALKDREGRYLMHNGRLLDAFGAVGRQVVGMVSYDLSDEAAARRWRAQDAQVLAEDRPIVVEDEVTDAEGRPRVFQVYKFPVHGADGRPDAVGVISVEITELKRSRELAEAGTRAKSEFLANMSHEIRTPLNAILGMAHLALKSGLTPRQAGYVAKIESAGKSLLGVINDILDFSKIEAGRLEIERAPLRIEDVLERTATVVVDQADRKGLELLCELPALALPTLLGDALRLEQVLVNLCQNAVKFTQQGEVAVAVRWLGAQAGTAELEFEVRDTGIGIAEDLQQRLFQPFVQADTSTSRRFGGTGLGLAICRQLVALMGGTLALRSAPGAGTTFAFALRFGIAADAAAEPPPFAGRRLLLVEGHRGARAAIAGIASTLGFQVTPAADRTAAEQAIEAAAADGAPPFDLLLLDADAPGIPAPGGPQALAVQARGAPVVLLVAMAAQAEGERLPAVCATLAKPVLPPALRRVCGEVLARGAASATTAPADPALPPPALRGRHVLVVEDNPLNRELVTELLQMAGAQATLVDDGMQALQRLAERPFDAVLMDCQLPLMDGPSTTRVIRSDPQFAALPVIAMTASTNADDRARAYASGMNEFVEKPIDVGALYAALARWIGPAPGSAVARRP